MSWSKIKEKAWEIGDKILCGVAESFGLSFGKKAFGITPHGGSSKIDCHIFDGSLCDRGWR